MLKAQQNLLFVCVAVLKSPLCQIKALSMTKHLCSILCLICLSVACTPLTPLAPLTPEQAQSNWYDIMPRPSWAKFTPVSTIQSWFEVYQLTDNTYAIYEPNQWQEAISYLLIGAEKALLVDTLQGIGDLKAVIDQLTDLPVIVINTHSHFDHVSSNHQFETVYGINNAFAQTNAQGHPHEVNARWLAPDTFWKNIPAEFSFEHYENKPFDIDKFVNDREIIDIGNRPIEVVFIPGHSTDSIMLVDKNNRMMLTGDSFYPAPIYLFLEESSFEDYFESVQLMLGYQADVDFLLPGHNETMLSADYLTQLRDATITVKKSVANKDEGKDKTSAPSTIEDGARKFQFDGFSLMVSLNLNSD